MWYQSYKAILQGDEAFGEVWECYSVDVYSLPELKSDNNLV